MKESKTKQKKNNKNSNEVYENVVTTTTLAKTTAGSFTLSNKIQRKQNELFFCFFFTFFFLLLQHFLLLPLNEVKIMTKGKSNGWQKTLKGAKKKKCCAIAENWNNYLSHTNLRRQLAAVISQDEASTYPAVAGVVRSISERRQTTDDWADAVSRCMSII